MCYLDRVLLELGRTWVSRSRYGGRTMSCAGAYCPSCEKHKCRAVMAGAREATDKGYCVLEYTTLGNDESIRREVLLLQSNKVD